MAGRRELVLSLISDSSQFNRGIDAADKKLSSFGKAADQAAGKGGLGKLSNRVDTVRASFSSLTAVIGGALAGREVLQFAQDSIRAFSDLEQAVGGVETVFGSAAGKILDFAETADQAVGLSESAFNTATTRIGGMLQNLGFAVDEAADKSIDLVKVGADLAATYGGSVQEALDAVAAALRGETDPIERYAISVKQADVNARALALGLTDTTSSVDKNAKAVATLDLIYQQAAKTTGQFAREADTVAGKTERLQARFENVKAEVGENLLPAYIDLLDVANELVPVLAAVASEVGDAAANANTLLGPLADVIGFINRLETGTGDLGEEVGVLDQILGSVKTGFESMFNPLSFFRDLMEDSGEATSDLVVDIQAAEKAVGSADKAYLEYGAALASAAAGADNLAEAQGAAQATSSALARSIASVTNALLEQANPAFAAVQAAKRAREAEEALLEVREDQTATVEDVAQAELDYAQAVLAAQAANDAFNASGVRSALDAIETALGTNTDLIEEYLNQLNVLDGKTVTNRIVTELIDKRIQGASQGSFPGRATGGPVSANQPYLVGERGPELFVPESSGQIVPNNQIGGGITVNQTFQRVAGENVADDIQRGLLVAGLHGFAEVG